jgi:heme oxygenase
MNNMELTIKLNQQQLNYLILESNKQNCSKEKILQQLLDIQIEMQEALEADLTFPLET